MALPKPQDDDSLSGAIPQIVIVDDDDSVRHSLQWLVESAGYTVRSYGSGKELLADLGRGCPGCVILDVHMPELNGVDLYGRLRARYPGLPAIFITGHPDHSLSAQARASHPAAFFSKPLDAHALLESLRALLPGSDT